MTWVSGGVQICWSGLSTDDITARKEKPFSIFRRVIFGLYGWRTWNYDSVNISSYSSNE